MVAARDAFITLGFDNATLGQIAATAGIAMGTQFLYASSKEELLAMVFMRDLPPVIETTLWPIRMRPSWSGLDTITKR